MTQLLVSVRNSEEARAALEAGAAVIDVKEPRLGSLGAASPLRWQEVLKCVDRQTPVSVALGELMDPQLPARLRQLPAVRYAKIGLADCRHMPGWEERWRWALEWFRAGILPVAVVYADWRLCGAPPPLDVLHYAQLLGCRVALWDTCCKQAGNLLDHLPTTHLASQLALARQAGLSVALAGSLDFDSLPIVLPLHPDFIAVRGAVCSGSRQAAVDPSLVSRFAAALTSSDVHSTPDG